MQFKYHSLIDALFCEVNPIPVKKAMQTASAGRSAISVCRSLSRATSTLRYVKRELENAGCKIRSRRLTLRTQYRRTGTDVENRDFPAAAAAWDEVIS